MSASKTDPSPYLMKREPWSSHQFILEWLTGLASGCTGLDVGTATGTLGELCAGLGLVMDGIEPQANWAAQAAPYYRNLYTSSLDQLPEAKLGGYDFVILGDVLEHLVDPQAALVRLASLQPPRCSFIISIPNVANIWVRLKLLLGHFDYQDRGILDRTHLHFYTWASFRELLDSAGLKVLEARITPIPLPQVSAFFRENALGRAIYQVLYGLTRLFPRLLGYQFVVKAGKKTTS